MRPSFWSTVATNPFVLGLVLGLVFLLAFVFAPAAFGQECVEKNLASFSSERAYVLERSGEEGGPCDSFGGVGAYTPRHNIHVFVNFNIATRIDLDSIDLEVDKLSPEGREFARGVSLVIVDKAFMSRRFAGADIGLNRANNIFFINERVAGEADEAIRAFYSVMLEFDKTGM